MSHLLVAPTRVRRLIATTAILGGLALALFTILKLPLVGVGVYVVAVGSAALVQPLADGTAFDERDEEIAHAAAFWTLRVFGLASAITFPALTVAWGVGAFEWQPWSAAVGVFAAVLFLIYTGFMLLLQRRK
jgi:hypothetical protein